MKAVVLVGGFGTRLRPLTLTTPKQMLPVVDRPMLEHVVAGLGRHGVDEVVLSLGYREDVFRDAYPEAVCAGVALNYAVEPEPLDTAGAVRFAALAAGVDETFIVVNGDVFTDLDVTELWNRHHEVGAEGTIALTPVEDPSRFGVVPTDDDGRVLGFVEKPPRDEAPTNWINAGTYVFEPSVLGRIPDGRKVSVERETFPAMVADGGLWAVQSEEYWVDAGTPETYLQIQLDLLDGVRGEKVAGVHPAADVSPDADVRRAVVMAGAVVTAGAKVCDSVVAAGATVRNGAVVDGSLVGPEAIVEAGAQVLDLTIIGDGVVVPSGAVLRGARRPAGGLTAMAVLVTGGAGYIGSHTVVALHESGREVVIVDDLSNASRKAVDAMRALTDDDLAFVEGDVADPLTLDRIFADHEIDEVVHFAAFKAVGESVARPLDYYRNNVGSTIALADAMVRHGVRPIVFSSSATVYGQPEQIPVTESAPTGAENPYGRTKCMSEQILTDAAAVTPLDAVLLRYFNPIGAHESGTLGEDPNGIPTNLVPFVMQVAVGRLERLSVFGDDYDTHDGTCVRDYIHVVDLAEGHVAALDAVAGGLHGCTAINLGTGVGSTVLEVVAAAGEAVGSPIPYEVGDRRPGDVEKIWADPSLASQLLGWSATRDLSTMLADHWRWQRTNPQGYAD